MNIITEIKEYPNVHSQSVQVDQVYTVLEIQRILKISRAMSYELVKSEAFPIIRIGRAIRIPTKTFNDWLLKSNTAVS